MKKLVKIASVVGILVWSMYLHGMVITKNQFTVHLTHTAITESQMQALMTNDGATSYLSQFSGKVFVYKLRLVGGGGYYSSTLLRLNLNKLPVIVIGKGTSDDNAAYRVSVGADSSNMYGFNNQGWVNLTSHWTANSMYILLDSKWGTNFDTELDLWMAFSSPLDSTITYEVIRYNDSFGSFDINSYQIYVNPHSITVQNGSSFTNDLNADGASSFSSNFSGNYAYRIDVWGGGGYYSDCLLKLYIDKTATFAIAKGTSDANDNVLRTGVGEEVNHLVDVQQSNWVNVTSQFQHHYTDLRLNSKWGTNNDSHIIIWISTNQEIQDIGYSLAMYPDGFGSINVKKYDLNSGGGGNTFSLPFSDNFDDGDDSDWSWYTWVGPYPGGQPSHQVVNGVERIVTHDQNATMLLNGTSTLNNYYFEADFKIAQLLDDAYGGIYVYIYSNNNITTNKSHYWLDICKRSSRWRLIAQYSSTSSEILAQGSMSFQTNRWYHIKMEVKGDTVFAYLDGQLLGRGVPSNPLTGGFFGFGGSDDIIEVDNVHVDYVTQPNSAPSINNLSGPSTGTVGQSLTFVASGNDPDGDDIYIQFDWGDGDTSNWLGPYSSGESVTDSHIWTAPGTYIVKARAKDSHGNIGSWSQPRSVSITNTFISDTLKLSSANSAPNSPVYIPVSLVNSQNVGGVQFKIQFDHTKLILDSVRLEGRATQMQLGYNIIGQDTLIVMVYSPNAKKIAPGSDEIMQIKFEITGSAALGDSTMLDLFDVVLSDTSGNQIPCTPVDGWVYFRGRKGDLNQDGHVNILDVVRAVNIALHIPPQPTNYERWAADMNDDGIVNVLDIIQIVNVALSGGKISGVIQPIRRLERKELRKAKKVEVKLSNSIQITSVHGNPGDQVIVPVTLQNTDTVGGLQFSLYFDHSILSFDSVYLSNRGSLMNIGYNLISNDTLMIMVYSTSGQRITPGSGDILNLLFSISSTAQGGDSTLLKITNAILSNPSGYPINLTTANGWIYIGQDNTSTNDTLRVVSNWAPPGQSVTVPIELVNQSAVSGIQTTIHYDPNVISYQAVQLNPALSSFSISANNLGDSIKIVIISMQGDSILPGIDTVFTVTFAVDSNAVLGDSTYISLSSSVLSDPIANVIPVDDEGAWLYIRGRKGDLNQDGVVNVVDAVRAINIIILRPPTPTPYERWAADMNDDGTVNVVDVVAIINVILQGGKHSIPQGYAALYKEGNEIILSNTTLVSGIQFDLVGKPESIHVTNRLAGMRIFTNKIKGGLRVVIVGLDGASIGIGRGSIIRFDGDATIENVVISDPSGKNITSHENRIEKFDVISLSPNPAKSASFLEFAVPREMHVVVNLYDVSGRLVRSIENSVFNAGIYKVRVETGNLKSGIYFVEVKSDKDHRLVRKLLVR